MTAFTLRPAWTPLTIALTILGFVIYWPLGLAMLVYVIWGDRLKAEFAAMKDRVRCANSRGCANSRRFGATGNTAFDAYKESVLKNLEEQRRALAEEQRAFEDFLRSLRQARDKEEFDRFMAERNRMRPAGQQD